MSRIRLTARASVSFALAGFLWIVAFLGRDQMEKLLKDIAPWLPMNQALYLAAALALAVVVFIGVWSILRDVSEWALKWYAARRGADIIATFGSPADIPDVLSFGERFYDDSRNLINAATCRSFLDACPHSLRIFRRAGQLVGFYFLFPLNKAAVEDLLSEQIRSGQQLNGKHSVKSFARATGIYVPNICASEGLARGKVMLKLEEDLLSHVRDSRSLRYIFGRGANDKGIYYYRRYGFEPLGDPKLGPVIWVKKIQFKV
ncbi:MAG: hypothetical protein J0L64_23695 [Acidobacteria bacterium]|nr:hypothetical protein [Acidobacteriota bacterium]